MPFGKASSFRIAGLLAAPRASRAPHWNFCTCDVNCLAHSPSVSSAICEVSDTASDVSSHQSLSPPIRPPRSAGPRRIEPRRPRAGEFSVGFVEGWMADGRDRARRFDVVVDLGQRVEALSEVVHFVFVDGELAHFSPIRMNQIARRQTGVNDV